MSSSLLGIHPGEESLGSVVILPLTFCEVLKSHHESQKDRKPIRPKVCRECFKAFSDTDMSSSQKPMMPCLVSSVPQSWRG